MVILYQQLFVAFLAAQKVASGIQARPQRRHQLRIEGLGHGYTDELGGPGGRKAGAGTRPHCGQSLVAVP